MTTSEIAGAVPSSSGGWRLAPDAVRLIRFEMLRFGLAVAAVAAASGAGVGYLLASQAQDKAYLASFASYSDAAATAKVSAQLASESAKTAAQSTQNLSEDMTRLRNQADKMLEEASLAINNAKKVVNDSGVPKLALELSQMPEFSAKILAEIRNSPVQFSKEVVSKQGSVDSTSQTADFCALSKVSARAWPQDATSTCTVTQGNDPRSWILQATSAANGTSWCKMVCLGAVSDSTK